MPFGHLTVWRVCATLTVCALTSRVHAESPKPKAPSAIERRFAEAKKTPPELYAFLYEMPKGADLHSHLSGAVYAETFLAEAAQDHLCIDTSKLLLMKRPDAESCAPGQVDAAIAQTSNSLENAMIDSLSMRDFVPGKESAHDHFFATFGKFNAISSSHVGRYVAEVARRAADQNESYLELMAISGGGAIGRVGDGVGFDENNPDATRKKLEVAGLGELVAAERHRLDEMEEGRNAALDCRDTPDSSPCRLTIRYIFEVARENKKPNVFAQIMAGFALAAADSRIAAVNFVQPEDGLISMRDYAAQMRMVDYAHRLYPEVHITLHAGELAPGLVPPSGLRFHIRQAIEVAHAERIGHGVDVMYEQGAEQLLDEMRDKRIAVEINLTSNDLILGISGDRHPFPIYLKHQIPAVICTDDEGVSRTDLTGEYQRAVLSYDLTYPELKNLVRNGLEYAFLPGASYWEGSTYPRRNHACASIPSLECREFVRKSEKARLQTDLEERFRVFEAKFGSSTHAHR